MLTKYVLTLDGAARTLAPDSIKNWDEIECAMKRSDYDGIMRSFTSKFEFVGDVADDIREHYLSQGISASATLDVYVIDNEWRYNKVFSCQLDFSSITWSGTVVSVSCIDNSLAAMIKARKGTKYEFEVGKDIQVLNRLAYDRVQMLNTVEHSVVGVASNEDGSVMIKAYHTDGAQVRYVQTYLCGEMETYEGNPILSTDQTGSGNSSMFEAVRDVSGFSFRSEVSFDTFYANRRSDGASGWVHLNNLQLVLAKQLWNEDGSRQVDENGEPMCSELARLNPTFDNLSLSGSFPRVNFGFFDSYEEFLAESDRRRAANGGMLPYNAVARVLGDDGEYRYYVTEVIIGAPLESPEWELAENDHTYRFVCVGSYSSLSAGDRIFLGVDASIDDQLIVQQTGQGMDISLYFPIRCSIKTQWTSRAETVVIDTLRPQDVAQALLDKVTDGKVAATVQLSATDTRLPRTRIIPAESVRGIPNAKFYSSFDDFCSWMETVYGYTYCIVGTDAAPTLDFKPRRDIFPAVGPVSTLPRAVDVEYSVESKLLYSSIEVGYAKKDYNKVCGRDEWNFLNEYTTGYEVGDKKLSLKSPYRADCYGFEFLAQERSADSKDSTSDNDTFFVLCASGLNTSGQLTLDRTTSPVSGAFSETVFNGAFSPYHCLKSNEAYICAMGSPLVCKFASNDGNSSVRVKYGASYVDINSDVTLSGPLFSAGRLTLTSDTLVADADQQVRVTKDGLTYTGFVEEVTMRYARDEDYDYKLIIRSIV